MRRLLVVRLGSLGDLVHTLPAFSAIRRAHPDLDIDWLVDAMHEPFLALVPGLSSVVALRDRTVGAWLATRRALRARTYDVALDFQGLLKSAALARLSGATRVLGFDRSALRESAAAMFHTDAVDVGEGRHVIEKNLALASAIGTAIGPWEFPLRAVESEALREVEATGVDDFVLLNPGAAWPNKRWPPERFGRVARWMRDEHGLRSVALWGPGERDLAEAVVAASSGAAIAAPETGIADLVALSRRARLFLSGDTGPTHIAAAVGTPIVALFGPTTPARNGPWAADDVTLSRYDACECHYERRCRRDATTWCLGSISEADVQQAIATRLTAAIP